MFEVEHIYILKDFNLFGIKYEVMYKLYVQIINSESNLIKLRKISLKLNKQKEITWRLKVCQVFIYSIFFRDELLFR
jgi:hypothetical protein